MTLREWLVGYIGTIVCRSASGIHAGRGAPFAITARNALTWPSCANNITLITYNLNNIHTPARALRGRILMLADSMYGCVWWLAHKPCSNDANHDDDDDEERNYKIITLLSKFCHSYRNKFVHVTRIKI